MTITVVRGMISQNYEEVIEFIKNEKKEIIGAITTIEPCLKGYDSDKKEEVKEPYPIEVEIKSASLAKSLYDYVSVPKNMSVFKRCKPIIIGELVFDFEIENKKVGTKTVEVRRNLPPKMIVSNPEGFIISGDLCLSMGFVRTGKDVDMRYSESGSVTAYNTVVYNTYDASKKDPNSKDKNIQKGLIANWIDIKLSGKKAEAFGEYITKGQEIFLSGMMQLGLFTPAAKDGETFEKVKKLSWNIFDFQFVKSSSGGGEKAPDLGTDEAEAEYSDTVIGDEEIPF